MAHAHPHDQGPARGRFAERRRVLVWTLSLNVAFMVVELAVGLLTGSLALIGDAAHMATDVAALLLALGAERLSTAPGGPDHTFGYRRAPTLAALGNAVTMVALAALLVAEAFDRLAAPPDVVAGPVLVAGFLGLGVNVGSAWLLHREMHAEHSHNLRGALLHMMGDALGSLGVIASAIIISATGWMAVDPLVTLGIALLIAGASWPLLRDATRTLMLVSPGGLDVDALRKALVAEPGVTCVEDLHAWELDAGYLVVTATVHVACDDLAALEDRRTRLRQLMAADFDAAHVTLELVVESDHPALPARPCVGGL